MTIRNRVRSFAALAVTALMTAATLGSVARAAPNKPFSADILPSCVSAGSTVELTVTLRNETSTQQLGSADLTPPNGFTLVGAAPPASVSGNVLHLRGLSLPPGGSTTATFQVTTPTTTGAYGWNDPAVGSSIVAKQSNDFNGPPGNNLTFTAARSHATTFVGTCELEYLTQPQDAEVSSTITSVRVTPTGTPVQVVVEDGLGNRVTTFQGDVSLSIVPGTGAVGSSLSPAVPSVSAVDGVASFDAAQGDGFSIDTVALDYRIRASAGPGIAPADSLLSPTDPGFDVVNDGVVCSGPGCNGNATRSGVSVTVAAPNAQPGDVVVIALDVEALTCEGYVPLAGVPVATFSVSGNSHRVVTFRVPAALAVRPAPQDRVCYSSALPFTDRAGNANVTTGLLADCKPRTPLTAPCQFPTEVDHATGDHIVSFRAPAGATRGRT
jgi:hypothetical protein